MSVSQLIKENIILKYKHRDSIFLSQWGTVRVVKGFSSRVNKWEHFHSDFPSGCLVLQSNRVAVIIAPRSVTICISNHHKTGSPITSSVMPWWSDLCVRTRLHTRRCPTTTLASLKKLRPQNQTQKPAVRCDAVGRSDKSIWGKLSVRNFRSNCLGQNWLLGRANPAA